MKSLRRSVACLFVCFLLTGCVSEQDRLIWMLGSNLVLLYALSLTGILILHRLHSSPAFLQLVERFKSPASLAGWAVGLFGAGLILFNVPNLFDDPGPDKLKPFLGLMVLIAGIHLVRWANASEAATKSAHAKVLTMSLGFFGGLWYLVAGGGDVL